VVTISTTGPWTGIFRATVSCKAGVTYRTRKERKLLLTSNPHMYEKPARHRILVKVTTIFGNEHRRHLTWR